MHPNPRFQLQLCQSAKPLDHRRNKCSASGEHFFEKWEHVQHFNSCCRLTQSLPQGAIRQTDQNCVYHCQQLTLTAHVWIVVPRAAKMPEALQKSWRHSLQPQPKHAWVLSLPTALLDQLVLRGWLPWILAIARGNLWTRNRPWFPINHPHLHQLSRQGLVWTARSSLGFLNLIYQQLRWNSCWTPPLWLNLVASILTFLRNSIKTQCGSLAWGILQSVWLELFELGSLLARNCVVRWLPWSAVHL